MVYEYHKGTTTWLMRGFGWDPDTKCVTADKDVWDEYVKSHSRAAQFRTKSFPNFESLSMVWGKDRAVGDEQEAKAKEVKQGKKKVVVNDSSGSDDNGWKPRPSADPSSDTDNEEDDSVAVDKRRARLFKKLKRKQRKNVAPEAKADYNQTKLEDYDMRSFAAGGFVYLSVSPAGMVGMVGVSTPLGSLVLFSVRVSLPTTLGWFVMHGTGSLQWLHARNDSGWKLLRACSKIALHDGDKNSQVLSGLSATGNIVFKKFKNIRMGKHS
ncbi:hypothetical protein K1719_024429 [Acacia pycnantha]|nr:hypothetical protein K1719_024429 [Acacia pycnantha]